MNPRRFLARTLGVALVVSIAVSGNPVVNAAPARPLPSAVPALTSLSAAATAAAAVEAPGPDRMPGDVPSRQTPWVLDGQVTTIVQVGDVMVAAGRFTQVADPMGGTTYDRTNLFAFDAVTGQVSQGFDPRLEGPVQQLMAGPEPGTVFVAGDFSTVDGAGPDHLRLLDVATGGDAGTFRAPATNGGVQTMQLLPGNRLFVGGFFTELGGAPHGQLATLDATTGAVDPFLDLTVAGHHNDTGSGAQASVGVRAAGLTPSGDRLVVTGNFRTVGGLPRNQVVMLDLTGARAVVATSWNTSQYAPICAPTKNDSYIRDVEMSPDGSFFVIAATGGAHAGTLCDSAARFETYAVDTSVDPTWTARSGGDTLWGVEITHAAVYLGGHNRWMNNPDGRNDARQGSVPRPGLSALDPQNGVPLRWNPGRNPRGEAAYELLETGTGLWVVSNTDWIGNRRYHRSRIAFFPYAEGSDTASRTTGSLPGHVYIGGPAASSDVLYRVNAGGAALPSRDAGPGWAADRRTTSLYRNSGSTTATRTALPRRRLVGVPSSTPPEVWLSERRDPAGGGEMRWSFPVPRGTTTQVRLFFASRSSLTRRFSVLVDGVRRLRKYDPNVDPGVNRGTMKSFDVTSDGRIDIEFTHVVRDPEVNAVEILDTTAPADPGLASVLAFDGSVVASRTAATTALDWRTVRGAMMVGRTLFYGQADGYLYQRPFDGTSFGVATRVDPYRDPLWSGVRTGSGPDGQTYAGALPTWYAQLPTVTGMFYADGRVYYTRSGQGALYWRWFSPDSGVVGGIENTVTGGTVPWTQARGMFLAGTTLYVVDGSSGRLLRTAFVDGTPTGSTTVADAVTDWRGRAVFLSSVHPDAAPTASFTSSCRGTSCSFDARGSSDPDGTVSSWAWTFGDGSAVSGSTPQKDFAASGTYDVTLTVTDDDGLASSVTHQIGVERPNDPPTAAFSGSCGHLDCTFDASASSDPDGVLDAYAWDFGDGTTATGSAPGHHYSAPGTYTVVLSVSDDAGASDRSSAQQPVTAAPTPSTVAYVGGAASQGNATEPGVSVPAGVTAGDRLLLVLSLNATSRVLSEPSGVAGWTVLGTTTGGSMSSRTYTRIADGTEAGRRVTVGLDLAAKYTITVAVYSGVRPESLVHAELAETIDRADHTTPGLDAPAGSWVVSYWADKSAGTTGFALPPSVTGRLASCGTGPGHVCSVLADSAGPVPSGPQAGVTASADTADASAVTSSIVLRTLDPGPTG